MPKVIRLYPDQIGGSFSEMAEDVRNGNVETCILIWEKKDTGAFHFNWSGKSALRTYGLAKHIASLISDYMKAHGE